MARNYRNRTPVYVTVKVGTVVVNYGFNSGMAAAEKTTLGQTAIDYDAPPAKLIFGANAPKPYKASQKTSSGFNSSWASHDKIANLKEQGWTITPPKTRSASKSDLSDTYYVDIGGIKYAWTSPKMPAAIDTALLTTLGIKVPTANDVDLIFGASIPKPARYVKTINGGTDESTNTFSIFIDPTKEDTALTSGFKKQKDKRVFAVVA